MHKSKYNVLANKEKIMKKKKKLFCFDPLITKQNTFTYYQR